MTDQHAVFRSDLPAEDTRTLTELALERVEKLCDRWLEVPALRRGTAAKEVLAAIKSDPSRDLMLESLGPSPRGGIGIHGVAGGPESEAIILAISDSMGQMLDEHDAENYVEFTVQKRGRPTYTVCVRRHHKPTPHQLRMQADAKLEQIRDVLRDCTDDGLHDRIEAILGPVD